MTRAAGTRVNDVPPPCRSNTRPRRTGRRSDAEEEPSECARTAAREPAGAVRPDITAACLAASDLDGILRLIR